MKTIIFALLFSLNSYGALGFSIQIPVEVIEAMDLSPELARRLSGGDIIGNGGGLVEQEFRFAYRRLPRIIENCITSLCPFAGEELDDLSRIGKVAKKFIDEKDRLIFLSESDYPGFFRDSVDSQIRIAKTAFIAGAPIFVNLDMVYNEDKPAIDFSTMVSILVHEIGHQAGIRSHSYLDDLGAKLRDYLTQDAHLSSFLVRDSIASVRVFNLKIADHFAEMFFRYRGDIVPLTLSIRSKLSCKRAGSIVLGFEVTNPHWERLRWERGVKILGYRSWLKVQCLELSTSAIWTEDKDLSADFHFYNDDYLSHYIYFKH